MPININEFIQKIRKSVDDHRLEEGEYARWLWQSSTEPRNLGVNEYGCADAANILYMLNEFESDPEKREKWIAALKKLQNPVTGMYEEPTHHPLHTTAHCIAALELFDAFPDYPFTDLLKCKEKENLYALLGGLDWVHNPWPQSHQGAGIYASFVITGNASPEWTKWYFDWFWNEADEQTGMWRKGYVIPENGKITAPLYQYMAAAFHYLFNHEYAKMPLRYPEKMIDSCLELYHNKALCERLGKEVGFVEIDWLYCLNRASRQTPHRYYECKDTLKSFAKEYVEFLYSLDTIYDEKFNDLHMLFGATCALAELQLALPGEIMTNKPLRLVLERRPFI